MSERMECVHCFEDIEPGEPTMVVETDPFGSTGVIHAGCESAYQTAMEDAAANQEAINYGLAS